jgi:hypothetical protein
MLARRAPEDARKKGSQEVRTYRMATAFANLFLLSWLP